MTLLGALEGLARPLLVLHTVAAGVLVGASTHHALLCRKYPRGEFARVPLDRLYVVVCTAAYALTFAIGLLQYPAYKVRVRAEYLDAPVAIAAEVALRAEAGRVAGSPPGRGGGKRDLGGIARLFDVKEHWAALGMAAALALLALSRWAHPSQAPRLAAAYLGLSLLVCGAAWLGAIVGLLTTSYRSVGGVT